MTKQVKWWTAFLFFVCAGTAGFAWYTYGYVSDAKSGNDPYRTYVAYHLRLLGEVKFGKCTIRLSDPWLPKLVSYESLLVQADQVDFVDVDAPIVNDRAVSVSFVRNTKDINPEWLKPVEVAGSVSIQYIERTDGLPLSKAYAKIPETGYYVVSKDQGTIRRAMRAATITCDA